MQSIRRMIQIKVKKRAKREREETASEEWGGRGG